jgi:L-lysine exporter family protein LysE/ArgO
VISATVSGFLVGLSLILAIGAQNAFLLRQGLRREHVGWVVAIFALSDAVLFGVGVTGFGAAAERVPVLGDVMRLGGAAFLIAYGALRFRAALRGGQALVPSAGATAPLRQVVVTCLLLTWANPHVYLDTLVLVGSLSAQHAPFGNAFGVGAALASGVFFSALGFGARLLAPVFARPAAWVWLEVGVGLTMWAIAGALLAGG